MAHAGRHHRGRRYHVYSPLWYMEGYGQARRTRYTPCTCIAYAWSHRPGGGLCRWPEPPLY